MLAPKLRILADDLTGAANSAIAFARCGIPSCVIWNSDDLVRVDHVPVLAFDTETRHLGAKEAADRTLALVEHCFKEGSPLFKKIDSTLRGQPAAEIAAIWDFICRHLGGGLGVLAPAFPHRGLTTQNGRVFQNGAPLDSLTSWKRDHVYRTAKLAEILATASVRTRLVPLGIVRKDIGVLEAVLTGIAEEGRTVAICDAVEQTDLDNIAFASRLLPNCRLFIGSAGLARSLAFGCHNENAADQVACRPPQGRGALVVVGSTASESQNSALALARKEGVQDFPITVSGRCNLDLVLLDIVDGLHSGHDILVRVLLDHNDLPLTPLVIRELVRAIAPATSHASAVVATGGDTAFALLNQIDAREIQLVREIEPGVVLGVAVGRIALPIVTKAGAFGGGTTLSDIVDCLRLIRNRGSL